MQKVPYPDGIETLSAGFVWEDGFAFPEGFKEILKEKFPDWDELHQYANRDDLALWSLLHIYQKKIGRFKAEEILELEKRNMLQEIPDRVRAAMEMQNFIDDLEKEFFPEKVAERERRRQEALDSWIP